VVERDAGNEWPDGLRLLRRVSLLWLSGYVTRLLAWSRPASGAAIHIAWDRAPLIGLRDLTDQPCWTPSRTPIQRSAEVHRPCASELRALAPTIPISIFAELL